MSSILSEDVVTAWARLLRVAQSVQAGVEADLKAAGLPPLAWYDVLLELDREEDGALRPYQLCERMLLPQYGFSRLADRLVRAGYVERQPCPEDGRGQVLRITELGRDLRRRMWPAYAEAVARRFADRLDGGDAAALGKILAKLLD